MPRLIWVFKQMNYIQMLCTLLFGVLTVAYGVSTSATPKSYSQIGQDTWVLETLKYKVGGYFVEAGAHDGVYLSNTYLLEKDYGWKGLCIEANPAYTNSLRGRRKANIAMTLLGKTEGEELDFCFADAVSTIESEPVHSRGCASRGKLTVKTLANVLRDHNAPNVIDYLSIDIEGSEIPVLETFPFDKYMFKTITVEHNEPVLGPHARKKQREILQANGYVFVKGNDDIRGWGHGPIDDFYVHKTMIND